MCRIQRIIIYRFCGFNDREDISVDFFGLCLCYRDLRIIDVIIHTIGCPGSLFAINKRNFICTKLQRYRLAALIRAITGDRDCIFCNFLPDNKIWVGDNLIIRKRVSVTIHIVNGVAQWILCPVGINRCVCSDWFLPVIEFAVYIKPTFKCITCLGWVVSGFLCLIILLYSLITVIASA